MDKLKKVMNSIKTNWLSIDQEKCDLCNFCVVRCPHCFRKTDGMIVAQADVFNCNLCGHCISLCKPMAIVHEKMAMDNFPESNKDYNFATSEFIQFIRNRRSHRHFKNKAISKQDLETLIDTCRYTPTGSNVQTVEIIVLQEQTKIKKLSDRTVDVYIKWGGQAQKKIKQLKSEGKNIPETLLRTKMYGERLRESREAGLDPIFHKAPVVMIFHSPVQTSTPKDNCVIASTTLSLLARTMGIESTYIGFFVGAAKDNQSILTELQIPEDHELFSVIIMGYPRLKFHYTIDRKPIRVRWE